ncbi:uncharacterized protein LOC129922760 isoform X2 [Biomphalaria glabrata]|nr:uncharacterized protein LOC129922760 isoform X2 [Biomphalaria glabrata]
MCMPAQETNTYTFDFQLIQRLFDLSELQIMRDEVVVSVGDTDSSFIDYFETIAQTDVSRVLDGMISIRLTIRNVTRHDQGNWRTNYLHNGRLYQSPELNCYLKTFVQPQDIWCQAKLNGAILDVRCNTHKTFPQALCVVRLSKDSTHELVRIDYTHESFLEDTSSYFRSTCFISINISNLAPKELGVNVTMYPNVTNTPQDLNYGEVKSLHYNLIEQHGIETHTLCTVREFVDTTPEAEQKTVNMNLPLESTLFTKLVTEDKTSHEESSESTDLINEHAFVTISLTCVMLVSLGLVVHKLVICRRLRKRQNDQDNHFYEVIDSA